MGWKALVPAGIPRLDSLKPSIKTFRDRCGCLCGVARMCWPRRFGMSARLVRPKGSSDLSPSCVCMPFQIKTIRVPGCVESFRSFFTLSVPALTTVVLTITRREAASAAIIFTDVSLAVIFRWSPMNGSKRTSARKERGEKSILTGNISWRETLHRSST
jgi:hypothetical protein